MLNAFFAEEGHPEGSPGGFPVASPGKPAHCNPEKIEPAGDSHRPTAFIEKVETDLEPEEPPAEMVF